MSRLIVVSNRLPFTARLVGENLEFGRSSGGLVSALDAYLSRRRAEDSEFECIWVGWPGSTIPKSHEDEVRSKSLQEHSAYPVFLSEEDMDNFYHGFCNNTLWPLFHYFPSYAVYNRTYWETYSRVNRLFLEALIEILRPDDTIWVHDYQLLLLPGMIRSLRANATIGLFLHIPFPAYELFRLLPSPWRKELLLGMLGADLVGFHTYEYTQYFLHCVFRTLGYDHHLGQISLGDQTRRADTFPIGIDFNRFMQAAQSPEVAQRATELREAIRDREPIFSVDRLDYTKGILNRLRGYEEFLERDSTWHSKVVFVLVVVPSRAEVPQYQRMKQELDERVGQINGRFGTIDWAPIMYQYRSLDFETLVALYQLSPVALITPMRDGMNLVAKEYLASKPDGTGVLILSEMAGAARELGEAVLINPNHWDEIADSLQQALTMPRDEQIRRNRPMQERLKAYDAQRWATDFLNSLSRVKAQQGKLATKYLSDAHQLETVQLFRRAHSILVLLDYDGTLVPFAPQPHLAQPDNELIEIIERLRDTPRVTIALISGRDRDTLDNWFGSLRINMIGEHGAWMRSAGHDWRLTQPLASDWKERLAPILRTYVGRVPGSLFEEKEFSVAWHYRRCDPDLGAQRAKELVDEVTQFTANLDLQVLEGKKVVEIRNAGVSKGAAATQVLDAHNPDFIIAIGDDQTDEDLFRAMPPSAVTVRVGMPFSHARFSLNDVRDVRRFLNRLIQS